MKSPLLLLIFCLAALSQSHAQSAWDIAYTEAKTITKELEGRKCKPDFFPLQDRKDAKQQHYRYNLSRADTLYLQIDGEKVAFFENRKIYVDWGLYREQCLQSVAPDANGMVLRIGEVKLVKVKGCSIDVETELEYYAAKALRKGAIPTKKKQLAFTLNKRDLQGLIFQK